MNPYQSYVVQMVEQILNDDRAFIQQNNKTKGPICICLQCHKNEPVGLYPMYHVMRRSLCKTCGPKYVDFLKHNDLID